MRHKSALDSTTSKKIVLNDGFEEENSGDFHKSPLVAKCVEQSIVKPDP